MNKFSKFLFMGLALGLTVFSSCKDDDDNSPSGSHKVVFKAIGSANVDISVATYSDGAGKNENFTSLSGSTWTSQEYIIPSSAQVVTFGAGATGPDVNSTLVAEIWVDGEKKIENKATGKNLTATAMYNFK